MIGLLVSLVMWPIHFVLRVTRRFVGCIRMLQYSAIQALIGLLALILHLLGVAGLVAAAALIVTGRMRSPGMLITTPEGIRVLVVAGAAVVALVAESLLSDQSLDRAMEDDYRRELRMRARVEAEEEDRLARIRDRHSPEARR